MTDACFLCRTAVDPSTDKLATRVRHRGDWAMVCGACFVDVTAKIRDTLRRERHG